MRELLAPYGIDAVSAGELGLAEPEETGTTFAANARIKAEAAAKPRPASRLRRRFRSVVEALGRRARHSFARAGPAGQGFRPAPCADRAADTNAVRLARTAAARISSRRCALDLAGRAHARNFEARVDGALVWPPRGTAGFGYDPLFLPDGHTIAPSAR
jgi:XTP/dITP diphosphohydrolase